jgi:tetratricopeptide (TPR) repeat protein
MAHLGKGNQEKAKLELQQLLKLSKEESLKEVTIWDINTVYDLVSIATKVLEAELWASEGEFDTSIILLKDAVVIEDALNYNEPPDWFFSIRHHLGNIQLKAEHYENAIKTFEDDLKRLPKNGWAHHGLKQAYEKLGNTEKAKHYEDLIKMSWIDADYTIE